MSPGSTSSTAIQAPPVPLHLYLSRLIDDRRDLTNVEIAKRLGYPRPNVIAMMRTGSMKVPLSKVPALAEILGIDPISMLQRVLLEYDPDLWTALASVLGKTLVTKNELALITTLRDLAGGTDPAVLDNKLFVEGFKALVGEAIDVDVAERLAARPNELARRVSETARVNTELEDLCRRQAQERQELRRRLMGRMERGFDDSRNP